MNRIYDSIRIIRIIISSRYYHGEGLQPEINGYNSIAGGIYTIVFMLFDIGTAFGIERFIAEFLPYPEINGFKGIVLGDAVIFLLMNLGMN